MTAPLISLTVTFTSALAPITELAFVLQLAGLGAGIGSAVALRARHRDPDADTWRITTAWATLGLIVGSIAVLVLAVA